MQDDWQNIICFSGVGLPAFEFTMLIQIFFLILAISVLIKVTIIEVCFEL